MKIDLIIAIKEAYQKIYADKIKAKQLINNLKELKKEYSECNEKSQLIEKYLVDIWQYLPIEQRKDYVQKTADLLHYAFDLKNKNVIGFGGMTKFFQNVAAELEAEIEICKEYYNNHEYFEVIEEYSNTIYNLNKKLIKLGIKEDKKDD